MPQWKFPYDRDGVPSLDMRVQTRRGSQIELSGTVDSGASSTVLSLEHADELGLAHASPLWGQADFFAVFGVMFWRNIAPPQFELSY